MHFNLFVSCTSDEYLDYFQVKPIVKSAVQNVVIPIF